MGTVLVIWGLITLPLMAAMPVSMVDDSAHSYSAQDSSVMNHTMGHNGDQDIEKSSMAPCHEENAAITNSAPQEPCNNCDKGCCMNGICTSSCTIEGTAVFQGSFVSIDLISTTSAASFSRAHAYGLPSRIFHPPKQV